MTTPLNALPNKLWSDYYTLTDTPTATADTVFYKVTPKKPQGCPDCHAPPTTPASLQLHDTPLEDGTRVHVEITYYRYKCVECARRGPRGLPGVHSVIGNVSDRLRTWISTNRKQLTIKALTAILGIPSLRIEGILKLSRDTRRWQYNRTLLADLSLMTKHKDIINKCTKATRVSFDEMVMHAYDLYLSGKRNPSASLITQICDMRHLSEPAVRKRCLSEPLVAAVARRVYDTVIRQPLNEALTFGTYRRHHPMLEQIGKDSGRTHKTAAQLFAPHLGPNTPITQLALEVLTNKNLEKKDQMSLALAIYNHQNL